MRLPHVEDGLGDDFDTCDQHLSFPSPMAKRYADSAHGVKIKVKKQKGIRVRTASVLDSDAEDAPPDIDTEYARLLKTRVATSGKADSVTMNSLQLFEVKDVPHSDPEPTIDSHGEVVVESAIPPTTAKKPRKKKNDSVRCTPLNE